MFEIRKQSSGQTFKIENYLITIINIKNNVYGNPRYEVIISDLDLLNKYGDCEAIKYRFTGHYWDKIKEVKWVLQKHLER